MATDDPTQDGQDAAPTPQDGTEPHLDVESLKAERDALRASREQASRDAEKYRKELAALKRAQAGQPTPEELQRERDEAIRERDEARAERIRDRQDLAIARAAARYLDPEFLDLAPDLIDRGLIEVDDDGKILSGLDRAFQALVKARPKVALPKKPDGGTGPVRHPHGGAGNGKPTNPIAAQLGRKTSLGT